MPEEQLTEQVAHARCLMPPTLSLLLCVACPCELCGARGQWTQGLYSSPESLTVSPEWSLVGAFRTCRRHAWMGMQITSLDNLFGAHRPETLAVSSGRGWRPTRPRGHVERVALSTLVTTTSSGSRSSASLFVKADLLASKVDTFSRLQKRIHTDQFSQLSTTRDQ